MYKNKTLDIKIIFKTVLKNNYQIRTLRFVNIVLEK